MAAGFLSSFFDGVFAQLLEFKELTCFRVQHGVNDVEGKEVIIFVGDWSVFATSCG